MKNKIKIAVIDDGINEKVYNTPIQGRNVVIHEDLTIVERNNYDAFLDSHGTICAAIIHKYTSNIELTSVKILNDITGKAIKDQLIKSLYWCAENNINIANLSIGTIDFRDFEEIRDCLEEVTRRGLIIVAACNNRNVFTYPACHKKVIGVKCNRSYLNDQYSMNHDILMGIEFLASGNHSLVNRLGDTLSTIATNSYAAPLITAKVCNIMQKNADITLDGIKEKLYEGALDPNAPKDSYLLYNSFNSIGYEQYINVLESCIDNTIEDINIPVIRIIFDNHCGNEFTLKFLHYLNKLFRDDGYYSIGISDIYINSFYDLEIFPKCKIDEKSYLSYILKKYNCDIIIMGYSTRNKGKFEMNHIEKDCLECDIQVFVSMEIDEIENSKKVTTKVEHTIEENIVVKDTDEENIKVDNVGVESTLVEKSTIKSNVVKNNNAENADIYVTFQEEIIEEELKYLYDIIMELFSNVD